MAGAGTGLPGQRGQVASTIVDQQGYGAGEMAAAEGFARAADGIGRLMNVLEPAAQQAAKAIAEQEVAAGRFEERVVLTGADAAFNDAMRTGTLARLANDADSDLDKLRAEFLMDPDGFNAASEELRRRALDPDGGVVPGALAQDWVIDFDRRRNAHLGVIRNARAAADLEEAKGNLVGRIDRLTYDTVNLRPGATLADVMADPQVEANVMQITLAFENLANNPAFGMSREEVDAKRQETMDRIKAGAVTAWAQGILRDQGSDAALAALQGVLTDESVGDVQTRQLVFNAARDAVQQELSLTNQRRAQAQAERSHAEQELNRLIEADIGQIELTGEGTGLTAEQVSAVGGPAMLSRWLKARADAREWNGLIGDLPLNDPDAAAAQIATAVRAQGFDRGLPIVQDENDLNGLVAAITQVESGGVDGLVSRDPDGAGPAGGGAMGRMQLLPATAQRMAQKLGLPFDAGRLRTDAAYNERLGRAYLSELLDRYSGDSFLAITAYHAGEGNVDGWLRSVGDPRSGAITREAWLERVEARGNPRSAEYPRKVLAAMQGGRVAAAWDAYDRRRSAQSADPAGSVATDFAVRSAAQRWQQNPNSTPAAEAYVDSVIMAQERQGVPEGRRRSLPNASLVVYAAELDRFARAGDMEGFRGYSETLVRRFGSRGERVLQDALEVRGDTRFASAVAARVTAMAATGQRPAARDIEQAGTAARANTMARSANGAARPARQMSDAELQAALGASPLGD